MPSSERSCMHLFMNIPYMKREDRAGDRDQFPHRRRRHHRPTETRKIVGDLHVRWLAVNHPVVVQWLLVKERTSSPSRNGLTKLRMTTAAGQTISAPCTHQCHTFFFVFSTTMTVTNAGCALSRGLPCSIVTIITAAVLAFVVHGNVG